jgi:hypothetical protein
MDWRSITVSAEVDIYLHDIKDEVLEMLDNDELIGELSKRAVKYEETSEKYHMIPKDYVSPDKLYRYLCDIVGVGYHEPKDSLLNKLKDMI